MLYSTVRSGNSEPRDFCNSPYLINHNWYSNKLSADNWNSYHHSSSVLNQLRVRYIVSTILLIVTQQIQCSTFWIHYHLPNSAPSASLIFVNFLQFILRGKGRKKQEVWGVERGRERKRGREGKGKDWEREGRKGKMGKEE